MKELVKNDKNEWEYVWHLFNLYQTTEKVDNTFEGNEGVDELAGPELLKELKQSFSYLSNSGPASSSTPSSPSNVLSTLSVV